MNIQHTDGCTCNSLTINDVETIDMPIEQVKQTIKKLIDGVTDIATLQQVLIDIVDLEGVYKDLGQCETCGDFVSEYTLEVPDE